uniref:Tc1-like transposase DDE domain-containing protein n=1 Tax=Lygus hesperus TaxID=30085 RepID=A0A0A9WFW1_LYGHE
MSAHQSYKRPRRQIRSQERAVIANVIVAMEKEKELNALLCPLSHNSSRVAEYTGASKRTIQRINAELKASGTVNPPEKRYRRPTGPKREIVDDFDKAIIRKTIDDFYLKKRKVPCVVSLLTELKSNMDFPYGRDKLRQTLIEMGYVRVGKSIDSKRRPLLERRENIDCRYAYLEKIMEIRQTASPIFYVYEQWIDCGFIVKKCWQGPTPAKGHKVENIVDSNSVIMVNIGSEKGYLPNAQYVFRTEFSTGDKHGQTIKEWNHDNFCKWIEEKVIPNLPESSVIVMDDAPYHKKLINRPPSYYATKAVMVGWLASRGCGEADVSMRKTHLVKLIEKHMPPEEYVVDSILETHGHRVVRLPPYNGDLNPSELIWGQIKNEVQSKIVDGSTMEKILNLTSQALMKVKPEDWKRCCNQVVKLEKDYWNKDEIMDDVIDGFLVDAAYDFGRSNDEDDGGSETHDDTDGEEDDDD